MLFKLSEWPDEEQSLEYTVAIKIWLRLVYQKLANLGQW